MKETGPSILKTEQPEFNIEQREENTEPCEKEIKRSISFSDMPEKEKWCSVLNTEQLEGKTEVSSLKEDWREKNIRRLLC